MKLVSLMFVLMFSLGMGISSYGKTEQDSAPAPVAKPAPTPATAPTDKKPTPLDLTTGLSDVMSLNRVITNLKKENGIDKLETELSKQFQDLMAQAAKEGYHYDPPTNSFVENPPPAPAPAKDTTVPKTDTKDKK